MLFNWNSSFSYFFVNFPWCSMGITHIFIFFHFLCYSMETCFFSFHQYSILFNGNHWNIQFFVNFPCYSIQWCNDALKLNRAEIPLCSTGHCPLWGRCPANHHLHSQTYKAGQWVSLTTYCPWATGLEMRKAWRDRPFVDQSVVHLFVNPLKLWYTSITLLPNNITAQQNYCPCSTKVHLNL